MINKKIPMRTCIACKECKPKKELLRIVATNDTFVLDKSGKLNGRGAYICNNEDCLEKLIKQKSLNKCFKQNIDDAVYQQIKENFFENR